MADNTFDPNGDLFAEHSPVSRPGISASALADAGVRRVPANEALQLVGHSHAGILIPYYNLDGSPLKVASRPFYRLRLDKPVHGAKYLSPKGMGCQLYCPRGLAALLTPSCYVYVVEGEFKAIAMVEAGIPAVAIGGITAAAPGGQLLPDLQNLIKNWQVSMIAFVGDSDTCLNFDFSREAVKLAALIQPIPVVLPRIRINAPGKGPDDLRQTFGPGFPRFLKTLMAKPVPVTPNDTPSSIALELFRREVHTIAGLPDTIKIGKVAKLTAAIAIDSIAENEIEQLATSILKIPRSTFKLAVKSAKRDALKTSRENALIKAEATLKNEPLHYDGTHYWRRETNGVFGKLLRPDAQLHLNNLGLSRYGDPAPCDVALREVQKNYRVTFAGPLCGRPAGPITENGIHILVTNGPTFIEPALGNFPTIERLLVNLLGRNAGDAQATMQEDLFIAWLQFARKALRDPSAHRPGQVLGLIGPKDSGKSLLQFMIITPSLGGRCADPTLFFSDKTAFNADLLGAEHLAIGDHALDVNGAQRSAFRNALKRAVAEPNYPLHSKGRDGLTLRPIWRISISANDDPESAANLPELDASFSDKIIYLRTFSPLEPFFDTNQEGTRELFSATIRQELPAFLHMVDHFLIPKELRKGRFGVMEWHHPLILDLLQEADPLQPISDVLQVFIDSWTPTQTFQEFDTVELYTALDNAHGNNLARHRISSGPKHLGHQLAKLRLTADWAGQIERIDRRVGGRVKNIKRRGWKITRKP